jgi:hypothetical protein
MSSDIHVLPEHDLIEHEQLRQCPCRPTVEIQPNGVAVVIHHSADGREYFEDDHQHKERYDG